MKILNEEQMLRLSHAHDEAIDLAEAFENCIPRDTEIAVAISALTMVIKFALAQLEPEESAKMHKAVIDELANRGMN